MMPIQKLCNMNTETKYAKNMIAAQDINLSDDKPCSQLHSYITEHRGKTVNDIFRQTILRWTRLSNQQ